MYYHASEELNQHRDDYGPLPTWDDENEFGGQYDDGDAHSDVEDSNTLVSQPRQVGVYLFLICALLYGCLSVKYVDMEAYQMTSWSLLSYDL